MKIKIDSCSTADAGVCGAQMIGRVCVCSLFYGRVGALRLRLQERHYARKERTRQLCFLPQNKYTNKGVHTAHEALFRTQTRPKPRVSG